MRYSPSQPLEWGSRRETGNRNSHGWGIGTMAESSGTETSTSSYFFSPPQPPPPRFERIHESDISPAVISRRMRRRRRRDIHGERSGGFGDGAECMDDDDAQVDVNMDEAYNDIGGTSSSTSVNVNPSSTNEAEARAILGGTSSSSSGGAGTTSSSEQRRYDRIGLDSDDDDSDGLHFVNSLWGHEEALGDIDIDDIHGMSDDDDDDDDDDDVGDEYIRQFCGLASHGNSARANLQRRFAQAAMEARVPSSTSRPGRYTRAASTTTDSGRCQTESRMTSGDIVSSTRFSTRSTSRLESEDTGIGANPIEVESDDEQKLVAATSTNNAASTNNRTSHVASSTSTATAVNPTASAIHTYLNSIQSFEERMAQHSRAGASRQSAFASSRARGSRPIETITLLDDNSDNSDDDENESESISNTRASLPTKKRCRSPSPDRKKSSLDDGIDDDDQETDKNIESRTCCICLDQPTKKELSTLDGCDHLYCFSCIEKWSERENTCPQCKARFTKIKRVHKIKDAKGSAGEKRERNVKKVKTRNQRLDSNILHGFHGLPIGAFDGMVAHLAEMTRNPLGPPPMVWLNAARAHQGGSNAASVRDITIHDLMPPLPRPAFHRLDPEQSRIRLHQLIESHTNPAPPIASAASADRIPTPLRSYRYESNREGPSLSYISSTHRHTRRSVDPGFSNAHIPPFRTSTRHTSHEQERSIRDPFVPPRRNAVHRNMTTGTIDNPLEIMDSDEE